MTVSQREQSKYTAVERSKQQKRLTVAGTQQNVLNSSLAVHSSNVSNVHFPTDQPRSSSARQMANHSRDTRSGDLFLTNGKTRKASGSTCEINKQTSKRHSLCVSLAILRCDWLAQRTCTVYSILIGWFEHSDENRLRIESGHGSTG